MQRFSKINSSKQLSEIDVDGLPAEYYVLVGRLREVTYILNHFCHCELTPKDKVLEFLKEEQKELRIKVNKYAK